MPDGSFSLGSLVQHDVYGLGKIIYADSAMLHVYFRDRQEPRPESRIALFRAAAAPLKAAVVESDQHLDNLPPYKDGKFVRVQTELSLEQAMQTFLGHFPGGFNDDAFAIRERSYKLAASKRYQERLAGADPRSMDPVEIAEAIVHVYRGGDGEPLNLLYARIEEPAYIEALRKGGDATVAYLAAAQAFVDANERPQFEAFHRALLALPTRSGGANLDHWSTLTWLPFIAAPDRHFLVKPSVIKEFAALLPWDIAYRSELNHDTYRRCVDMALHLGKLLQDSAANLSGRPLDLIDVQSFMWVIERY